MILEGERGEKRRNLLVTRRGKKANLTERKKNTSTLYTRKEKKRGTGP